MGRLEEYLLKKKFKKVFKKLDTIMSILDHIQLEEKSMSVQLDRLTVEVSEIGTVVDSAIALLEGLAARLAEIANDPAAITALADELDLKANALAAAVAANTPVIPPEE
jgi:hypothetical protein